MARGVCLDPSLSSHPTRGSSHLGTGSGPSGDGGLLHVLLHEEGCLLTEGESWGPDAHIAAVLPKPGNVE